MSEIKTELSKEERLEWIKNNPVPGDQKGLDVEESKRMKKKYEYSGLFGQGWEINAVKIPATSKKQADVILAKDIQKSFPELSLLYIINRINNRGLFKWLV